MCKHPERIVKKPRQTKNCVHAARLRTTHNNKPPLPVPVLTVWASKGCRIDIFLAQHEGNPKSAILTYVEGGVSIFCHEGMKMVTADERHQCIDQSKGPAPLRAFPPIRLPPIGGARVSVNSLVPDPAGGAWTHKGPRWILE